MTDTRNLLERCARVMGKTLSFDQNGTAWDDDLGIQWMPTDTLADTAEMVVKMNVDVEWEGEYVFAASEHLEDIAWSRAYFCDYPTKAAAYCYAVCQVVAAMDGGE